MARRGYVQLANGFYLNRKVRRLRRTMPSAIGAFVIMLSYCGDNLTDGYVDVDTAEYVLDVTGRELDALTDAGLLEPVDGGYLVHDYLTHNRSREQVLRERKRTANRVNKHRETSDVTALHRNCNGVTSGQTPEHQNTRTPKKEKEEHSSSFSKEETADDYVASPAKQTTDDQISRDYPNLDLMDAWGAFMQHHQGATKTTSEWTRLWKGWCQRRATMSGIPPSKPHVHTWQCEHVLALLGRNKETAMPDTRACATADQLNRKEQQCSQATNDNKSTD